MQRNDEAAPRRTAPVGGRSLAWPHGLRLCAPQPLVGMGLLMLALLTILASGLRMAGSSVGGTSLLLALSLGGAVVAAYQFPLHIRPRTKVYMASVPYYLLAVLVPPPLAGAVAGLSALLGDVSVRTQRGTTPSQIATEAGRRALLVVLGASLASSREPAAQHPLLLLGTALVLGGGDLVTFPLVLLGVSPQPYGRTLVGAARDAALLEGGQYLLGLLGALAAAQQLWAPALLIPPTALVYVAFKRAQEGHQREQEARAQVEQALRVRDDFLISAAHDLRTPLTIIQGFAEVARMRLASELPADKAWLSQQMERLQAGTVRMAATVDDLTDLAQLQIGHCLALELEAVDVAQLVQTSAASLAAAATRTRAISVHVTTTSPLVVRGDRRRLERVVQNIIGNALKFSPAGTPVQVVVEPQEQGVSIGVQDQGVGIPAEEVPHIFERFYRASTAQGITGSGIGLASAHAIIEQHGGQISVQSAPGQGTTVRMWLPAAR